VAAAIDSMTEAVRERSDLIRMARNNSFVAPPQNISKSSRDELSAAGY
jgi:hypothetical protein